MINPVQYELERAYHNHRQQAAARQRLVAEAEQQSAAASTSFALADVIVTRLRSVVTRAHALALPRRQVAEFE